ncbi:thiamine diphosphate-binding protein [Talaromyces proteolyticus]|uniref:Thiamine diphosphate-binding protein n=1 Tax=Talaromyces proteolyticus TaxID=1131652 RepID=A0AAD4KYU5_9EURO|nr:thiamine diphosphate-binding protein [Talaromyces proteolyticus]KAH8702303.1 thiamine diphosphate-binding protein [Talaromyces proteolyticus]
MLVMVGWRGKPGEKDEPQHALIGPRLLDNLRANDFPFEEIPDTLDGAKETIARLIERSLREKTPVALIVPRNTFAEYESDKDELAQEVLRAPGTSFVKARRWLSPIGQEDLPLSREFTIRHVLEHVKDTDASVSSLGGNSRELYMIRKEKGDDLGPNFFCIGAMGHAFALAHGLALGFPSSRGRVWCIDGDGSFLMHIGNNAVLAGIGTHSNVVHIVIFNAVYSSTGSQPLMISPDNFLDLAEGLPYRQKVFVDSVGGLQAALLAASGGTLIVVVVNDRVSKSLPRPKETVEELRGLFLKALA